MFGQESVIVSGFDAVREMLSSAACDGSPEMFRLQHYSQKCGYGFEQPNEEWKICRKATFRGIRAYGSGLSRMDKVLSDIAQVTMSQFGEKEGEFLNPWEELYTYMLRSTSAFIFGENIDVTDDVYKQVKELDELANQVLSPTGNGAELDIFPWLRFLNHPVWKKCKKLDEVRDSLWSKVKQYTIDHLERNEPSAIGDFLMQALNNNEISERRMKNSVGDLLVAGTISTTASTYALLNILAHHKGVQEKVQEEVDRVVGRSDLPCLSDEEMMPYTAALLLELQRYLSVTPLGLPHCATADTQMAGYTIKKDTPVLYNSWALHNDENIWGDPSAFRPERFLDEHGALLPSTHVYCRSMVAFGLGRRTCPGRKFAMSRVFFMLTLLMQKYTIEADPENPVTHDPSTFSVDLAINPTPYTVKLCPRA